MRRTRRGPIHARRTRRARTRRGQIRRILLAVLIAFLFQAADLGLRNLATRFSGGVMLMYLNAFLPVGVGLYYLLNYHRRPASRAALLPEPAA